MSATLLKLLAVLFMSIDHIGEFIPGTDIVLRYIGRLAYPIFLYCALWSLHYTHDRIAYFKRLYIGSAVMAVIVLILNNAVEAPYCYITNNIFSSLLLTVVIIHTIELLRNQPGTGIKWLGALAALQVVSIGLGTLLNGCFGLIGIKRFFGAVLPNILWCEGGSFFIIMGVVLYFLKESKWKFSFAFVLFSLYFLIPYSPEFRYEEIMQNGYQSMQVFALPFILAYNHKPGRKMKWFFYIYYPAHIVVLFLLGNCLY